MFRPDDELTVVSVFRLGSNGRFNKPAIVIFAALIVAPGKTYVLICRPTMNGVIAERS
jgi:hypothetical protein